MKKPTYWIDLFTGTTWEEEQTQPRNEFGAGSHPSPPKADRS